MMKGKGKENEKKSRGTATLRDQFEMATGVSVACAKCDEWFCGQDLADVVFCFAAKDYVEMYEGKIEPLLLFLRKQFLRGTGGGP